MTDIADVITVHFMDGEWAVYIDDERLPVAVDDVVIPDDGLDLPSVNISLAARRVEYIRTTAVPNPIEFGRFSVRLAEIPDTD